MNNFIIISFIYRLYNIIKLYITYIYYINSLFNNLDTKKLLVYLICNI